MENQTKPKFKKCTVCGSKIGFFRRAAARRQDKTGDYYLTQTQFCTPKCAKIGIKILSEISAVKKDERLKASRLIEWYTNVVVKKRQEALKKYGSIDRIPNSQMARLYPGTLNILNQIKNKLNEDEAEGSKFPDKKRHQ